MPEATAPIGMFDSGVGGLAVLAQVRRLLPGEDVIYFADTAMFPYGDRSPDEIRRRAREITRQLMEAGAKLVVVACNTATSAAIAGLRTSFDVPFVGAEPALKPAAERTRAGSVALLATPGTARGEKLAVLIDRHGRDVHVEIIEAPGLAAVVEDGRIDTEAMRQMVRTYADSARAVGADVLALGCTHYAFLRAEFERELGPGVEVIEPSEAIARQVLRVLDDAGLRNPRAVGGSVSYRCSGDLGRFEEVRDRLLKEEVAT